MRLEPFILGAVLAAGAALLPGAAFAARNCQTFSCVDIVYYATAAKTKVVGVRSTCPGRKGLRGRATRFFDRDRESYEVCTNTPPKLPCEFLPAGCPVGLPRQP